MLTLRDGGIQHKVNRSAPFSKYIYDHHLSWHKFATKRGYDLRVEDIVLVSGCVKTSGWALAAYSDQESGGSFSVSLSASGLFTFSPNYNTEDKHYAGVQHREGPAAGPSSSQDQCVFVQYYKCLPKGLGAARIRRPENLKESDMREYVPDEYFCAPLASVRRWFRRHFGNCCCCGGEEEPEAQAHSAQRQVSRPNAIGSLGSRVNRTLNPRTPSTLYFSTSRRYVSNTITVLDLTEIGAAIPPKSRCSRP